MKINGVISSLKNIVTGVPQSSVLGPLLFISFINDLTELESCYLFSDDYLLIAGGKNPSLATANMENHISNESNWYQQNLLTMNSSKTNVMTISKDIEKPPNLNFQNQSFKQVDKIKYLGVFLDKNLNFKRHGSKMKQKLYPIITNFERSRKFLSPSLAAFWSKGLIRPNFEYCSPLLFCSTDRIKRNF